MPIQKKPVPPEVIEHFQKVMLKQQWLHEAGIYTHYVTPIIHQGKKVWALGNRVFFKRPPRETFHEFIIDMLRLNLGQDWWEHQMSLPEPDRHFIFKCFEQYFEWQKKNAPTAERIVDMWSAPPDGWSKSLLALAWDFCSLIHARNLPEKLLDRLKSKDGYQGARYEIAIAAIFSRLNCSIEWQDQLEENKSKKHCEFIATHKPSGISVAVETKSKHRSGVIHMPGDQNEEDLVKSNISRQTKEAVSQAPDGTAFIAFVDLNSPSTPDQPIFAKPWANGVKQVLDKVFEQDEQKICNAIFVTNYSYHYQTENEANKGEFIGRIAPDPKYPLPNNDFFDMLVGALNHYGRVPNLDTTEREHAEMDTILKP
jgi:hypothetical protein